MAPAPPAPNPLPARHRAPRRPLISPLTWRIFAVNLLALGVLFAGFVYLDAYRRGLIAAELATFESKAKLFAAAIAETATSPDVTAPPGLIPSLAQQMVRRLVEASRLRARLFHEDGTLIADSLVLLGPGGLVQIEQLPPPRGQGDVVKDLLDSYDQLVARVWTPRGLPAYSEAAVQKASDYQEVVSALAGRHDQAVRAGAHGTMVLSVAVPVQRYQPVIGALMLSGESAEIDAAVLKVRLDIVKWFLVALAVTLLLSIYLSSTIARPIKRLAAAAERVRRDRHRQATIPDFGPRHDEIGQLALALREMTDALWLRMDAIERFAADVAHEIKNPLSSLRSAVETVARIDDPARRERLMAIILDDVARLDRLISDISDASRLDAELSRADFAPVDLARMLATLIDVSETAASERRIHLALDIAAGVPLVVNGIEGRLVQVLRNLIANALSFSPAGGTITLKAARADDMVVVEILDDGSGIPDGREQDIFERFYSLRPKGEAFGVHSGLGLSISRQIAEAHGGSISAENRRDAAGAVAGARFVVTLPSA